MILLHPRTEDILAIQNAQQTYYYSHCFETIIRKNCYLSQCETHINESDNFLLVTRGIKWSNELADKVMVIEGPCDSSVYEALGLTFNAHSSISLEIECNNTKYPIFYSDIAGSVIPKSPDQKFISEDPFYHREKIDYHTYSSVNDWDVLAYAVLSDGEKTPIIVKKNKVIICGIPILDFLVFEHTAPKTTQNMNLRNPKGPNLIYIEGLFFELLSNHFLKHGAVLTKFSKWPSGYKSAVSVMHDFDRSISDNLLLDKLKFYKGIGIKASWFWLKKTFNQSQINLVKKYDHEVAVHVDSGVSKDASYLSSNSGISIRGFNCHGGIPSIGYVGQRLIDEAIDLDFIYGQIIPRHIVSCCAATRMNDNGLYENSSLILFPGHHSFDISREQNRAEQLLISIPKTIDSGSYVILMNHPDLHHDKWKEFLKNINFEESWKASIKDICLWFKGHLDIVIERSTSGCINVFVPKMNEALIIEFISSKGSDAYKVSQSGTLVTYDISNNSITGMDYYEYFLNYARKFLSTKTMSQNYIYLNTTKLKDRVESVIKNACITNEDRVMEMGCGTGFISFGILILTNACVTGSDISKYYLSIASEFLLGFTPKAKNKLNFVDYNCTEFNPQFVNKYTKVILNNMFCFVLGLRSQFSAIRNVSLYLKESGIVYFYGANSLHYKEPFTQLPFIHWVPSKILKEWLTKKFKKRTLSDIDYISPVVLFLCLKFTGFSDIKYYPNGSDYYKKSRWSFISRYFTSYYGMSARKK